MTTREVARGQKPGSILYYNMSWYGAADLSAIAANPASKINLSSAPIDSLSAITSFLLVSTGAIKSLMRNPARPSRVGSLNWQLRPARFYGTGYLLNGALAFASNPVFGFANLFWGLGAYNFDPEQNIALRRGIGKGLGLIHR